MSYKIVICLLVFVAVAKAATVSKYRFPFIRDAIGAHTVGDEDVLGDVVFDEDEDEDTAVRVAIKDVCLQKCIQNAKLSAKECNRECIKAVNDIPTPRKYGAIVGAVGNIVSAAINKWG